MAETLAVLVPSRGRPHNIARLADSWHLTSAGAELVVLVDDDDPELPGYDEVADSRDFEYLVGPRLRIGPLLNEVAPTYALNFDVVGFMGDDHLPRTEGWDAAVLAASTPFSVVYGNDLLQGAGLPTQAFLGSGIVKAWGRFVPDGLEHLYLDNAWKLLGEQLGTLTYLDDVVIEHLHYINGKAEQDAGYAEVNAPSMYSRDQAGFERWLAGPAAAEIDAIRAAMSA